MGSLMHMTLGASWTAVLCGALCLAAVALAAKFRDRIEAIPVQLSGKPAPSGPATPGLAALTVHANGGTFPIGVWGPSRPESGPPDRPQAASPSIPVVIYAPGWGGTRDDNSLLCAELASRGFLVVALDDISQAPSTNPVLRARDTAPFDLSSQAALEVSLAAASWRLKRMSARVSAIIDWLQAQEPANTAWSQHGRLESSRVAVMGFSFGGSVAAEVARLDPRVTAAINMDGWLFGTSAVSGTGKPTLTFNSDYPELAADSVSKSPSKRLTARLTLADRAIQVREAAHVGTLALLFRGTGHGDFSDELFTPPLGAYLERWRRTNAARLRLRRNMDRLIVGFLETYLTGTRANPPVLDGEMARSGIEILSQPPSQPFPQ